MNARTQQLFILLRLVLGLGLGAWVWHSGWHLGAVLIVLAMLGLQLLLLTVEQLLRLMYRGADAAPAASSAQLLRAWWREARARLQVFDWQQPFAEAAQADHWPTQAQGKRGVLLLHGFSCNRGLWNTWMQRLRAADVPFIALTLEPAFGLIDEYVPSMEAAVKALEQRTGCAPVLVGHSMGGIVIRAWWRAHGSLQRGCQVLTLGTPHAGTWMAEFAAAPNAKQMRLDSPWLQTLAAQESAEMRGRFCCYYSHTDSIVCPASSAALEGARQVHVPATGHISLLFDERPFEGLMQALKTVPQAAA